MILDEKIKEYIEKEKNEWQYCKEIWEKIKEELNTIKELKHYIASYKNDSNHQEMQENFNIVLDNIVSLANTFDVNSGMEIMMLTAFLIHNDFLSVKKYSYQKVVQDIKMFNDDKILYMALKVFTGTGCCRHTAALAKKILDKFDIENHLTPVDTNFDDANLALIRQFLHNYHKKETPHNHILNYIKENNANYFLDITSPKISIYGGNKDFIYSVDNHGFVFPIYSYSFSWWNDEFIDYKKEKPISKEKASSLIKRANDINLRYYNNLDIFIEFYHDNIKYYSNIKNAYDKIYEEEKRLKLIKE